MTTIGCNCYERDTDTNVRVVYSGAFGGRWGGNTTGVCGPIAFDLATGNDPDCDPTNGPAGSNGCVFQSGALPVELTFFKVEKRNLTTVLFWQTASEVNHEKIEIEESRNGREYQKIGEIEGIGTTYETQDYAFQVENPRNGISYYRLKQVDHDGQFEYSEVISVSFKGKNGEAGVFYPNPSNSGLVNLDYTSQSDETITISVFDVMGKLMRNEIQQVSNGNNNLSFDFSDLNTGSYIVKIGSKNNPTYRKLIIKR